MNSKLTGDGVVENDEVPKNHWHFHIETVAKNWLFGGPTIRLTTKKFFFYKKIKKNNKKSEKSFQSGPNLKSFEFNRGDRVDLRAPKAIGGPKNRVGAPKIEGGGPKSESGFVFFLGWGAQKSIFLHNIHP